MISEQLSCANWVQRILGLIYRKGKRYNPQFNEDYTFECTTLVRVGNLSDSNSYSSIISRKSYPS
jgi:hypothetical protein